MIGSSDSDSDDDKRVVRSAKDRRFDELKGTCEELRVRPCALAACPCELARYVGPSLAPAADWRLLA